MTTWAEDVFVVGSALKDCCYMTTWTGDVFVVGSALCLEGLLCRGCRHSVAARDRRSPIHSVLWLTW